jgi:trk system potassium uptake protein TrkH
MITGSVLLSLPVSRNAGFDFSFLDNLFMSASAVCITGLTVVNMGEFYSFFGQTVILFLIQLGGLGYMFVSTVAALLTGKMLLKDRRILQEIFDISSFGGLKKIILKALSFILGIEAAGAAVLTVVFLKEYPFFKALYLGIFHSVAGFCNAGFSPFANSLENYSSTPVLLYTIAAMIILGGLGFFVIVDLYDHFKNKTRLSFHSKVVLFMTAAITIASFLYFFFSRETGILNAEGSIFHAVNNSFFQAVSSRTAGFSCVPIERFSELTDTVLIFLMSAGAAPGSAAGGLKLTTLALVFVFVRGMIKSEGSFVLFKRTMPEDLIKKALLIFVVFVAAAAFISAVLVFLEDNMNTSDIVFEAVSALGTAGLSKGITPYLSVYGKIFVIIAMIIGRLGILTLLILMLDSGQKNVKYPESRILVG